MQVTGPNGAMATAMMKAGYAVLQDFLKFSADPCAIWAGSHLHVSAVAETMDAAANGMFRAPRRTGSP